MSGLIMGGWAMKGHDGYKTLQFGFQMLKTDLRNREPKEGFSVDCNLRKKRENQA